MNGQTGKGDYTLIYNGALYRFPTESERWVFLQEELDSLDDTRKGDNYDD